MILKILSLFLCLTPNVFASNVKTIHLCQSSVGKIYLSPKGSVLDFPAEPEKVILGSKGSFSIQYIRNDLAISPTTLSSKSNLFVYLEGRRFSLDLATSANGTTLYFIKDLISSKALSHRQGLSYF